MVLGIAGISLRNGAVTGRFRKASVRHAPTFDTDRHSEVYLDAEGSGSSPDDWYSVGQDRWRGLDRPRHLSI